LSQRPLPYNTQHSRQTSMPPVRLEPTISAGERGQRDQRTEILLKLLINYAQRQSPALRLQTGHSPEPLSPTHNPPAPFHAVKLLPDLPTGYQTVTVQPTVTNSTNESFLCHFIHLQSNLFTATISVSTSLVCLRTAPLRLSGLKLNRTANIQTQSVPRRKLNR
jgi:hypothetical protein